MESQTTEGRLHRCCCCWVHFDAFCLHSKFQCMTYCCNNTYGLSLNASTELTWPLLPIEGRVDTGHVSWLVVFVIVIVGIGGKELKG